MFRSVPAHSGAEHVARLACRAGNEGLDVSPDRRFDAVDCAVFTCNIQVSVPAYIRISSSDTRSPITQHQGDQATGMAEQSRADKSREYMEYVSP